MFGSFYRYTTMGYTYTFFLIIFFYHKAIFTFFMTDDSAIRMQIAKSIYDYGMVVIPFILIFYYFRDERGRSYSLMVLIPYVFLFILAYCYIHK